MELPTDLIEAWGRGRLAVLWGGLPFPLAARPPANRALALRRWIEEAEGLPALAAPLAGLPPLPLLSLDPTARIERAFEAAGVPLQVVRGRRDVPDYGRHVLIKLAGDLETRVGVVLSREEVREPRGDADRRYMLREARRRVEGGALLLVAPDPESEDFRAWWAVLAPALAPGAVLAAGEPGAGWPEGVACLGGDWEGLSAALWAARPEPAPEEAVAPAARPPGREEGKYVIVVVGDVRGLTIGDGARVEQQFAAAGQVVQGSWEALIAQVTGRLDVLGEQLDKGVEDLKRGQAALYRQVDETQREDLARVLAAVQQGRLEQGEMRRTLESLRRAMRAVMEEGLPMDAELRAAIADLTEGVESSLSLERKLELTLPLIPLILAYKMELAVDSVVDLHALWEELRRRFV